MISNRFGDGGGGGGAGDQVFVQVFSRCVVAAAATSPSIHKTQTQIGRLV